MMLLGATCAVLAGTFLAAVLLFGRFVVLAAGFFLGGSVLITLRAQVFDGWQGAALLTMALVLIVVGRPDPGRRRRVRP